MDKSPGDHVDQDDHDHQHDHEHGDADEDGIEDKDGIEAHGVSDGDDHDYYDAGNDDEDDYDYTDDGDNYEISPNQRDSRCVREKIQMAYERVDRRLEINFLCSLNFVVLLFCSHLIFFNFSGLPCTSSQLSSLSSTCSTGLTI